MIGTIVAAASLAAAAPADARDAYARRQLLLDADAKCQLLSARERDALSGAAGQARGALLRAGIDPAQIAAAASRRASEISCADEQLRAEAAAAQAAFVHWAASPRQEFPGEHQGWQASRYGAQDMMAWTLWQDIGDGYRIGQVESAEQAALVLSLPANPGAAQPRTVSVEYRDTAKWPQFVDPTLGGLFAARAEDVLARRAAPAALSARLWTSGAVEGAVQAPAPEQDFLYWSLPEQVLTELAALDPRDVARLTIEFADNTRRTLYVEVGDLAAARGFLAAGETPSTRAYTGS